MAAHAPAAAEPQARFMGFLDEDEVSFLNIHQ